MGYFDDDSNLLYEVVKNEEEQYSIWPVEKPIPTGWSKADFSGTKIDCMSYVKQVWTDMRPLSLRRAMAQADR